MSYGEWCPQCGAEIISVTRGIPSMGTCKNGHVTDRRDTLRRKPEDAPDLAAQVVKLTEALERLIGSSQALLTIATETGAFDSLMAELFPESTRRGVTKREEFKNLDRARNELRAEISAARAVLEARK